MPINFSLVDASEDVRQVLRRGIQSISGFTCVGCYASGEEALAGIPRAPGDVVLMDIRMPGMTGIECTGRLRGVLPTLPILILTRCGDDGTIRQALKAGAAGYLVKPVEPRECAQAMRDVLQGGAPLCREAAQALMRVLHQLPSDGLVDGLSMRERDLVRCLFEGLPDKEIAKRLGIAPGTVHTYLQRLYAKLKVGNRADAVSKYLGGHPPGSQLGSGSVSSKMRSVHP